MGIGASRQPVTTQSRRRSFATGVSTDLKHLARFKQAEDARKEAIAANVHDNTKENQQLLKKLFKRLDPSVSKVDTDVQGEIQVSVKYDFTSSRLLVNVIKCRDLGLNNIMGQTAEPFVELSLYPDRENVGTKRTSNSTKSQNPVFNEKFSFPLEEVSLHDQKLVLKVIDHDLVSDEIEFLGETVICMCDFNFTDSPVHTAWYTLVPETDLTITGELKIELSYTLPQSLLVTIHDATNLKCDGRSDDLNAVVKVGIPGIDQVSITQMKRGERNPCWDETFTFEVPQEELTMRPFFSHRFGVVAIFGADGKVEGDIAADFCATFIIFYAPQLKKIQKNMLYSDLVLCNRDSLKLAKVKYADFCTFWKFCDDTSYVVLTVLNRTSVDDSLLGHVVIDLDNLDIDHGYRGVFPLSDMSHNDRLRNKWFQTTQVQEFREALWAHSYFHYPNILFQNHSGKKVIRLTCTQAGGAKATLRLNNGIPVI